MSSKRDALREARARVAQARQALVDHDAKKAREKAETIAAGKKLAVIQKRSPVVVAQVANELVVQPLANIKPGYGAPKTPKELIAALTRDKDAVKLEFGGMGAAYSVRSVTTRLRVPTLDALRAIERTRRAERRAEEALAKARRAHADARREAFETGSKPVLEAALKTIAAAHVARSAATGRGYGYLNDTDWDRRNVERSVDQAEIHLAAIVDGTECACAECALVRSEAGRWQQWLDRISTLPAVLVDCPRHNRRHRMPVEDSRSRMLDEPLTGATGITIPAGHYESLPIAYCVGKTRDTTFVYIRTDEWARREAKRQKEQERAARRRPKLEWICPNPECGEVNEFIPTEGGYVRCEACDVEYDADVVKTVRPHKAA